MVNGIYFDVYRDDESESTWSEFSSRRSDFPDEVPRSSVYSTINRRIRSWIRFPLQPGSIPGKAFEDLAISLGKLKTLTGNFHEKSLVGQGSHSQVYRAKLSTGEAAAVKKLNIYALKEPYIEFAAEISKVSRLKHDNLLGFMGYCLQKNNRIAVHEFATMDSLHDILHGDKTFKGSEPRPVLTWNQRVKIAFGAARGLEYLHNEDIVHQCITSRNVFVFEDFVSKIAVLKLFNPYTLPWHSARAVTTSYYYPPEYTWSGTLTRESDIYCFGVVLLELLTGRKGLDHTMPLGQLRLVTWAAERMSEDKVHLCIDPKLKTDYPPKGVAEMSAIAALCVQYEPECRPDMGTVVKAMRPLLGVGETSDSVSPLPPSFP